MLKNFFQSNCVSATSVVTRDALYSKIEAY